ncbi:MAG: single-stranded-DNA-specific exonuclease RecJ [Treponema sp.]|nr:single-stranded-DNA-specific exonuclease RecJ [Treponema sp.]
MNNWIKTPVSREQIAPLCSKYNIDQLLASIFVRRGITTGQDILYYLESDLRFQHNPFLFNSMEDAVERINQAEEEGEKVLIFGDRDVDGVTSTTILYEYLKHRKVDVQCRLPLESDGYGLSKKAVEDFAAQDGTLIITVDCGISNYEEIAYAASLGIDVIITDHHNAPENLPQAVVILDPKEPDSGYPFADISGAAVAYKLVSALRLSHSDFYNSEICIIDVESSSGPSSASGRRSLRELPQFASQTGNEYSPIQINCVKIRNLVKVKELHETITPGKTSIYDLKLPYFLQGQVIYAWDAAKTKQELSQLFGSGIEFNIYDLRSQVAQVISSVKNLTTEQINQSSKIAKYQEGETNTLDTLYNLYVTYCYKTLSLNNKNYLANERRDLQLVALAAIADIMPLKDENRLFIKNGLDSIKTNGPRPGLAELFCQLKINTESLNAVDISWTVTPALNAAGRLGQADVALELLLCEDPKKRNELAVKIYELNEQRKDLVNKAAWKIKDTTQTNIEENDGKLCVIIDEDIHPGITGNLAGRIMQEKNVPAIIITQQDGVYKGSMRSCRGFITTSFLASFGDFFINFGGHNAAAGFSFNADRLELFNKKVKELLPSINLEEENLDINIDAEIPPQFLTPESFEILNKMEPFGAENKELLLVTKNIKLCDAMVQGKKEPFSLKLVFDTGKNKFPGMFFGQAQRLKQDIQVGKNYDILYTMVYNYFNGNVTPQFRLKEVRCHD